MSMAEVDIDSIIDYRREFEPYVKKAKISGDEMTGLCPFHEDKNNSFSVNLKTGKWHCFAEDIGGNFIDFYARIHDCSTKDAYKAILDDHGVAIPEHREEKPKPKNLSYSMEQYAFEKRLPKEFLAENCHITTETDRYSGSTYMKLPYLKEDGTEATFRKRYAEKNFRWKQGSSGKIILYGEWRLKEIRAVGYTALVEGESDSQSMWYMGISCLGVPGASMFKPKQADTLQDLKVYIHQEPDQGGETFMRKVTEGLKQGGFLGKAYKWSCSVLRCKDPSEVFLKFGREEGAEKIQKLLAAAEPIDLDAPDPIPEAIQGAPVSLRQPTGWQFSDRGIAKIDEKSYGPVMICRTPVILTKRLKSLETGEEKIEVAFKRDGEWQRAIYPRSTIFTARGITVLADLGCTVTSENAKQLVKFLSALESENIDVITKADATGTFGWQPGNRFIPGGKGEDIVLDIDPSQRGMASAYSQNGTFEKWKEIMQPHRERDKFRFILASAFTAPILRIIKQRIFFVYNWGSSKGGKTAGLKAALSAWGDPERLMVNFNATQVGLERTASFFCDLPLGIDERQLAGKNQESLEKIIYMIASGTGKIRGAKGGGLQALHTWRTVALATGEEPLATETSQTGVSTRVLEIYGGPFLDEISASRMHQYAEQTYGWAGPEFIQHLMETDEDSIRQKYDEMLDFVEGIADGKSGSHVAEIAAVALADAMADTWIFKEEDDEKEKEPEEAPAEVEEEAAREKGKGSRRIHINEESWTRAKKMAEAILQAQMDAETADVNENAVQFIVDWVMSNKAYFGDKAVGSCLGDIDDDTGMAYIFPSMLTQALTKAGYSARKTIKYMADNGIIATADSDKGQTGQRYSIKKRFGGHSCRFVAFRLGKMTGDKDPLEDDAAGFENSPENSPAGSEFQKLTPERAAELPF